MTSETRLIGDVTVLDLQGNITLGEGDKILKDAIDSLLKLGRKRFVLNLEKVSYIDSAGNGEVVRAFTQISRSGGSIILSHPNARIIDLFYITKLRTVYTIVPTVQDAIEEFRERRHLEISCPVCRSERRTRIRVTQYDAVRCSNCNSETSFIEIPSGSERSHIVDGRVRSVNLPTYENEWVWLVPGNPARISLPPRLDLFAVEVVDKAWTLIQPRGHVVFGIDHVKEFSEVGLTRLMSLAQAETEGVVATFRLSEWRETPLRNELSRRGVQWTTRETNAGKVSEGGFGSPEHIESRVSKAMGIASSLLVPVQRCD
jgi:anti-anti-sigma factor